MRTILLLCIVFPGLAQGRERPEPIIDMHLHAIAIEWFAGLAGPPPIPEAIELALESIESASFLTPEQRRDILFNNAVRFLRLLPEQVAAMRDGEKGTVVSRPPGE